jgi:hypothetical protein
MNRALVLVDDTHEPRKHQPPEAAGEALPLLETKLFIPRSRPSLVSRPRLTSSANVSFS